MNAASTLTELVRGCTFADFLLAPQFSVIERRDPAQIDLTSRLTKRLVLKRPLISANMDTVTRAPMAIVQAEEGGLGVIDRGFRAGDIESQVREVRLVKRTQHGLIADPYTITPSATIHEATTLMAQVGVGTLLVVDDERRPPGCPERARPSVRPVLTASPRSHDTARRARHPCGSTRSRRRETAHGGA
jgi:IMP dehydrogenase